MTLANCLVVMAYSQQDLTAITPTDSKGNTYTLVGSNSVGGAFVTVWISQVPASTGVGMTASWTTGGSTAGAIALLGFTGRASVGTVDATGSAADSSAVTSHTLASLTPVNVGDDLLACIVVSGTEFTYTAANNFSRQGPAATTLYDYQTRNNFKFSGFAVWDAFASDVSNQAADFFLALAAGPQPPEHDRIPGPDEIEDDDYVAWDDFLPVSPGVLAPYASEQAEWPSFFEEIGEGDADWVVEWDLFTELPATVLAPYASEQPEWQSFFDERGEGDTDWLEAQWGLFDPVEPTVIAAYLPGQPDVWDFGDDPGDTVVSDSYLQSDVPVAYLGDQPEFSAFFEDPGEGDDDWATQEWDLFEPVGANVPVPWNGPEDAWDWGYEELEDEPWWQIDDATTVENGLAVRAGLAYQDEWPYWDGESEGDDDWATQEWDLYSELAASVPLAGIGPEDVYPWDEEESDETWWTWIEYEQAINPGVLLPWLQPEDDWEWSYEETEDDSWERWTDQAIPTINAPANQIEDAWDWSYEEPEEDTWLFRADVARPTIQAPKQPDEHGWDWEEEPEDESWWQIDDQTTVQNGTPIPANALEDAWDWTYEEVEDLWWDGLDDSATLQVPPLVSPIPEDAWDWAYEEVPDEWWLDEQPVIPTNCYRQDVGATGTGTTLVLTLNNVGATSYLNLYFVDQGLSTNTVAVSDSQGDSFVQTGGYATSGNTRLSWWRTVGFVHAGTHVITCTPSGSGFQMGAFVVEVAGIPAAQNPYDGSAGPAVDSVSTGATDGVHPLPNLSPGWDQDTILSVIVETGTFGTIVPGTSYGPGASSPLTLPTTANRFALQLKTQPTRGALAITWTDSNGASNVYCHAALAVKNVQSPFPYSEDPWDWANEEVDDSWWHGLDEVQTSGVIPTPVPLFPIDPSLLRPSRRNVRFKWGVQEPQAFTKREQKAKTERKAPPAVPKLLQSLLGRAGIGEKAPPFVAPAERDERAAPPDVSRETRARDKAQKAKRAADQERQRQAFRETLEKQAVLLREFQERLEKARAEAIERHRKMVVERRRTRLNAVVEGKKRRLAQFPALKGPNAALRRLLAKVERLEDDLQQTLKRAELTRLQDAASARAEIRRHEQNLVAVHTAIRMLLGDADDSAYLSDDSDEG